MGPVWTAGLSVLNEHPVVVLQATSWVYVLVINRDTQASHGVPRPEGLYDPKKILIIHVTRENKKVHTKANQYKRCLLNTLNNFHFTDNKMKLMTVMFTVKINDGISCSPKNEH